MALFFMRNIKLTIQYDGTDFFGWQVQPNQRSVQEELQKAAGIIFRSEVLVNGSGRTDRGVHALAQTANFRADTPMTCERMVQAFNANLPQDVSVLQAEDVPGDFHARFDAVSKVYRYTVSNRGARLSVGRQYWAHYGYPLDIDLMRKELASIHGAHDFYALQGSHPYQKKIDKPSDTVRTILRTDVRKDGGFVVTEIEGDGFLYKMVRNIMGVVLRVGSGLIPEGTLIEVVKKRDRALVKYTARPGGLALVEVKYQGAVSLYK